MRFLSALGTLQPYPKALVRESYYPITPCCLLFLSDASIIG
jgi:hypothetical protein